MKITMTDILALADDAISKAKSLGLDYVDVRVSLGNTTRFQLHNNKFQSSIAGENFGIGVRVIHRGKPGFFSTNDTNTAPDALKKAIELSKVNPNQNPVKLSPAEVITTEYTLPAKNPLKNVSLDSKVALAREITKAAGKIKSVDVSYVDGVGDSVFANTEGTFIIGHGSSTVSRIIFTAKAGNRLESTHLRLGGTGFEKYDNFEEESEEKAKLAKALLKVRHPKAGIFDAVMDYEAAGVFAHEAVGHACEGDLILQKNSIFMNKIREQVGSKHVNLADSPAVKDEWGSYFYDDEGVPAQHTKLIKEGVLNSYLQSRSTAGEMGEKSTGNGRAQGYSFVPIVRMSNTFFEGGNFSNEELVENIKNGYMLIGFMGGTVNTLNGEFNFACESAREIKNGKLGILLKGCSFGGTILSTMHNIYGCGPFNKRMGIGWCGKSGQMVPAGDGACHVGIKQLKIGGEQ